MSDDAKAFIAVGLPTGLAAIYVFDAEAGTALFWTILAGGVAAWLIYARQKQIGTQ